MAGKFDKLAKSQSEIDENGVINHAESMGDVCFRFRIDSELFRRTFQKRVILNYGMP